MLTIRLARGGAKKRPYYRIVVAESSFSRDGRFVEQIGFSNPMATGKEDTFRLDRARYDYWHRCGAQPTDTVKRLIRQNNRAAAAPPAGAPAAEPSQ